MTSKPHPPAAIRLAEVDELVLDIEKLVAGGEGFGRYQGIPIFVPRSAPGDRLRVRVTERRTDYGRGEIVEILEPGPGRRPPPCSHFGSCGGCDLQHLEDEIQTELKAERDGEGVLFMDEEVGYHSIGVWPTATGVVIRSSFSL